MNLAEFKKRAETWALDYYEQKLEKIFIELSTALSEKKVDLIIDLSEKLPKIKEDRAIAIEIIQDAESVSEIITAVLYNSEDRLESESSFYEKVMGLTIA